MTKIKVGDREIKYKDEDFSVLSSLEHNDFHPVYNCRSGYCGSCKSKLISGKVSYFQTPLYECEPNEILICSCIPETDLELELID